MNRNRFSAVATISVPTLGIKGKKITEKEKYLETIDPAPATPAGEPLGEIEVEVSEEVAQRLKKSWSIEVTKSKPAAIPLLETSYPEELQMERSSDIPVAEVLDSPAPLPSPTTSLPPPQAIAETAAHEPSELPSTQTSPSSMEGSSDIPVAEILDSPAPLLSPTTSPPPQAVAEATAHKPSELPSTQTSPSSMDKYVHPPLMERSSDIPVAEILDSPAPLSPPTTSSPPQTVADTAAHKPSELPSTPSSPSPMDKYVHPPLMENSNDAPSLFRSRSFAALIDLSIASSFFVLGLLLAPDPPRVLPFVFAALYLLTKDSLGILNGQSVGKKIMKLRAVNCSDRTLTGNYRVGFMRNLSWLVAPIEFAILYVREDEPTKGKRLGDDWAKTQVIHEKRTPPRKSKWLP